MRNRLASGVALVALTVASIGLPCFAAARAGTGAMMEGATPMEPMPCEAPDAAVQPILCVVPATNAPIGVAPEEVPTSEGVAAAPGMEALDTGIGPPCNLRSTIAWPHAPGPDTPAFLLHAALLI